MFKGHFDLHSCEGGGKGINSGCVSDLAICAVTGVSSLAFKLVSTFKIDFYFVCNVASKLTPPI